MIYLFDKPLYEWLPKSWGITKKTVFKIVDEGFCSSKEDLWKIQSSTYIARGIVPWNKKEK